MFNISPPKSPALATPRRALIVVVDMFEMDFRVSYVQDVLPSMFGPSEKLRLRHPFQIFDNNIFAYTEFIEVEVRSCLPSIYMESIVSTGTSGLGIPSRYSIFLSQIDKLLLMVPSRAPRTVKPLSKGSMNEYAILPDSLPTIDALDTWARGALTKDPIVSPKDLEGALDTFLQVYHDFVPYLPMVGPPHIDLVHPPADGATAR